MQAGDCRLRAFIDRCHLQRPLRQRRIQTADLPQSLTQPPEGVGLRVELELTIPMPSA